MSSLKHYVTIILALILVGAVIYTPLSSYLAYIVAFLIVASASYIFAKRKQNISEIFSNSLLFIFVVLVGTLLIIFLTNGISSPLFFLLYFLIFGLPFITEPQAVIILLIGLLALFIPPALENDIFSNMVRIGSIIFISPLAFFFGKEFKKREKSQNREEIKKDTKKLPKDHK